LVLKRLELASLRCIQHADIELDPCRNVITGPNGAGKTSILEAAFVLGSGHSFKTPALESLIKNQDMEFLVVGRFSDSSATNKTIGICCAAGRREVRVDGEPARSLASLARLFPVQVVDPEVHRLLMDGPKRRRMFLDWGTFHVEPSFHQSWRDFNRALKQRNAQLRSHRPDFEIWDAELALHGSALGTLRQKYINALESFVASVGRRLLREEISLEYSPGWRRGLTLQEALVESRTRDQQQSTTTVGPHRADVRLKIDGYEAKDRISRGQQKLVACTLVLAQQLHRASYSTASACLLLDDPAAELDVDNLGKLLELVDELPVQIIATSIESSGLPLFKNARKFHVERGCVTTVA